MKKYILLNKPPSRNSEPARKMLKCPHCHEKMMSYENESDLWHCEACDFEITKKDFRKIMIKKGVGISLIIAGAATVIGIIIREMSKRDGYSRPFTLDGNDFNNDTSMYTLTDDESDEPITYNDVPDYSGCCPECPECGDIMGYSYMAGEFKCPDCGYIMDENDWDYDTGDPPWGCRICCGPYPDCKTSCKIFDD